MADDIVAFIRARLDQQDAESGDIHDVEVCALMRFRDAPCDCDEPARVLRAVEAKRRIVATCEYWLWNDDRGIDPCAAQVLRDVASEWIDHPDYQSEWKLT